MRAALAQSLSRPHGVDLYARGSIVVCVSCAAPVYRLERAISLGEKGSRAVEALRPVTLADLDLLAAREDIDAGIRAVVRAMDATTRRQYADTIPVLKAGDPTICPKCHEAMVAGRTAEASDTIDRAYVLELHVIPPQGHRLPLLKRGAH